MKKRKFTFYFARGAISVMAISEEEAKIRAQYEAIQKGWDYHIIKREITHLDVFIDWARFTNEENMQFRRLLAKAQTNDIYEEEKSNG